MDLITVAPFVLIIISSVSVIFAIRKERIAKRQLLLTKSANDKYEKLKSEYQEVSKLFSGNDEFLQNVYETLPKITEILKESCRSEKISVLNFGLDLETVVPWLNNSILPDECFSKVFIEYKALIINPDSDNIKSLIDGESDLKSITVKSRLEEIKKLNFLNIEQVNIEVKSYDIPPVFHGFILNDKHLFLSYTEIINGKLRGGLFPYIYMELDNTSKLNSHYFNMYKSWFSHFWNSSTLVYNLKK